MMNEQKIAAQLFLDSKKTDDMVLLLLKTLINLDKIKVNLLAITQTYLKIKNNEIKIALIKSAVNIDSQLKRKIEDKVKKYFKEDLIFVYEVDQEIAGLLIEVNDEILDLTINNFIK